jgi:hypothetical protein
LVTESEQVSFHPNWLRVMYVVNIFITGGIAVLLLVSPDTAASLFSSPAQEPLFSGYASSYMLAIALLCILGFRSPLKFSPLLFLQAVGKIVWLVAVLLPAMIAGPLSTFAIYLLATFLPILIGDLIVIPYKYIFRK